MTEVHPLDQRALRLGMVVSYAVVLLGVVLVAVRFGSGWSWWLFIWGAAFGPAAVVWFRWSNVVLARRIITSTGGDRDAFERRKAEMANRARWTYVGILSFGLGAGTLSAALRHPGPDIALTAIWIVAGVVPQFLIYPFLLRKAKAATQHTNAGRGDSGDAPHA